MDDNKNGKRGGPVEPHQRICHSGALICCQASLFHPPLRLPLGRLVNILSVFLLSVNTGVERLVGRRLLVKLCSMFSLMCSQRLRLHSLQAIGAIHTTLTGSHQKSYIFFLHVSVCVSLITKSTHSAVTLLLLLLFFCQCGNNKE